jgi:hypothetical protein
MILSWHIKQKTKGRRQAYRDGDYVLTAHWRQQKSGLGAKEASL